MHKKIYVCSPLRGDIEGNIIKAIDYCKQITHKGFLPIAPHIYLTRFLNDNNPDERNLGLRLGIELLNICDELWFFSKTNNDISEGMHKEIEHCFIKNITVKNGFFELGNGGEINA